MYFPDAVDSNVCRCSSNNYFLRALCYLLDTLLIIDKRARKEDKNVTDSPSVAGDNETWLHIMKSVKGQEVQFCVQIIQSDQVFLADLSIRMKAGSEQDKGNHSLEALQITTLRFETIVIILHGRFINVSFSSSSCSCLLICVS